MKELRDTTGLSWPYRMAWRLEYVFVTFVGPAAEGGSKDPKARLRLARAERVATAYAASGRPVPAGVQAVVAAKGTRANTLEYSPEAWARRANWPNP
jgi:hypothetical protein